MTDGETGAMAEEVLDGGIWVEVIEEAARAGVFRRAGRLNPRAAIWNELAEVHSGRVAALLDEEMQRLGA